DDTPSLTYYRIRNVWQNTYLLDGGDRVTYTTLPGSPGLQYEWVLEDLGNGQVEIRNASTSEYMHIENQYGYVQCTARTPGWTSSRWTVTDAGNGEVRFQNAWQPAQYIHIENLLGYAQHGTIYDAWSSAKWVLEVVPKSGEVIGTDTESLSLKMYPNPVTNGYLTVEISDINDFIIVRIIDLQGNTIYESDEYSSDLEIDLSSYNKGLYFIVVQTDIEIISKKIVIQ
ncbi:MAG: T9SS type A sorting domain-containing protein, partial [Bacteroidales bacterium]|nr:T9SS type A sorting domain-containing protein [Bacteroidales bacterium]